MAVQAQLYPESLCFPVSGQQQDWVVMVPAFDLGFNLPEPPQQSNLFYLPQERSHNLVTGSSSSSSGPSTGFSTFLSMGQLSRSLDAQLEMQSQEINCILQLQSERLKSALQQQRRLELAVLLRNVESKAISLMRQKEQVLAQSTIKRMELEARLKRAEMERESWQRLAREKEAVVTDLNNTLERVREQAAMASDRAQDAESSCGSSSCDSQQKKQQRMACKNCYSRSSCVLFLPCRHLCSCKSCEAFLSSCPVCNSVKEASLEVFLV
ncbi:probable BOI-related E3 ubiquitin-protein ligase 2 [Tripterygium wilfordii]|uniref:probable BOI-related E3 ubiquitin-protein ligase 2 n=1 Tax=Tripterygium wilfordii TaxID=458696 RepID=UPI0018F851AC|nr:probable BOI-related E3 ubiquitin-protein ligase 2 [Tripterygium wilfordii]